MNANLRQGIWGFLFLFYLSLSAICQENSSEVNHDHWKDPNFLNKIDQSLLNIDSSGILPGFGVAVFDKDQIFFQKGYGFADKESNRAYTPQTVQIIASVTKSINGMALMKLVDQGKINLDDPVNKYLPFELINPRFPKVPITLRHLATHTGSIDDPEVYAKSYVFTSALNKSQWPQAWHKIIPTYENNGAMDLAEFLSKIVPKSGEWYDKNMYLRKKPGKKYVYSNLGAALLGYIVEWVSGLDYRTFVKQEILDPLGMTSSTWYLEEIDSSIHTRYYLENYHPVPNYSINTYPDGGLYSTVEDLSKFLQEVLKGYAGEGTLLSQNSYREMLKIQSPVAEEGIGWDFSFPCCIGHSGNDFGTTTLMFFEPTTGIGRIIFANISAERDEIYNNIYGNMMPLLFRKE